MLVGRHKSVGSISIEQRRSQLAEAKGLACCMLAEDEKRYLRLAFVAIARSNRMPLHERKALCFGAPCTLSSLGLKVVRSLTKQDSSRFVLSVISWHSLEGLGRASQIINEDARLENAPMKAQFALLHDEFL